MDVSQFTFTAKPETNQTYPFCVGKLHSVHALIISPILPQQLLEAYAESFKKHPYLKVVLLVQFIALC